MRELSTLATRLISLAEIPGFLDERLIETMHALVELVLYTEIVKGQDKSSAGYDEDFDEQLDDYFNNEVLYVEHTLNSERYTVTGEAKSDNTMEGCVRLACLLFHNSAIWQFYPYMTPIFARPVVTLRFAVQSTIASGCYSLCKDLLAWILFTGVFASGASLPQEREFFVRQLAAVVRSLHVQSWQELREVLMGFFYVDRTYLALLPTLWDEICTMPVQQ